MLLFVYISYMFGIVWDILGSYTIYCLAHVDDSLCRSVLWFHAGLHWGVRILCKPYRCSSAVAV